MSFWWATVALLVALRSGRTTAEFYAVDSPYVEIEADRYTYVCVCVRARARVYACTSLSLLVRSFRDQPRVAGWGVVPASCCVAQAITPTRGYKAPPHGHYRR